MSTPTIEEIDERRGCTSASNAQADLLCAGRHLAQKGKPRPAEKPETSFGRRIHLALQTRKPEGLTVEERDIYESIVQIEVKKVKEFFGSEDLSKLRFFPETRIWVMFKEELPNLQGGPPAINLYEHSAKPDKVFRLGQRLLIPEYKTLAGDVPESPRNLQLRDQAVLARGHYLADEIGVLVIQPLVTHDPEICLYRKEDLDRAYQELFFRVRASNDPRSARSPGEVQCGHCLARHDCLEYNRWAGAMVPAMLNLLDVPVSAWSPEQRALFADRFDAAQKWLDHTWEALYEGAKVDPNFVPGYHMVDGAKRESITDPQKVFERFVSIGGTSAAFLRAVSITKTALKEQVAGVVQVKGKALDTQMAQLLDGCTASKQNKPSLKKL